MGEEECREVPNRFPWPHGADPALAQPGPRSDIRDSDIHLDKHGHPGKVVKKLFMQATNFSFLHPNLCVVDSVPLLGLRNEKRLMRNRKATINQLSVVDADSTARRNGFSG